MGGKWGAGIDRCLYAHEIAQEDYRKHKLISKRGPETRKEGKNEDFLLHNLVYF